MTDAPTAHRVKASEFAGAGCVVQGLGLLAPFVLGLVAGIPGALVGLIVTLVLLIYGGRLAIVWKCGACMNKLADKQVRVCPVCRVILTSPGTPGSLIDRDA